MNVTCCMEPNQTIVRSSSTRASISDKLAIVYCLGEESTLLNVLERQTSIRVCKHNDVIVICVILTVYETLFTINGRNTMKTNSEKKVMKTNEMDDNSHSYYCL